MGEIDFQCFEEILCRL